MFVKKIPIDLDGVLNKYVKKLKINLCMKHQNFNNSDSDTSKVSDNLNKRPKLTARFAVSILARCSLDISNNSASSFCDKPFDFLALRIFLPSVINFVVLFVIFLFSFIIRQKYVA